MSDLQLETTLTANAGPLNAALQGASRGVQELSAEAVAASKAQTAASNASTQAVSAVATASEKAAAKAKALAIDLDKVGTSRGATGFTLLSDLEKAGTSLGAASAKAGQFSAAIKTIDTSALDAAGLSLGATGTAGAKVAADGPKVRDELRRQTAEVAALGVSSRQTAAAMRTLPAQFTDIAVQLQAGQNPLTILLQQGGQIKDSFGGIGPAIRAITSLITPMTVALGGGAAAMGVMALAAYQGYTEFSALNKQLALMGPTTSNTVDSVRRMSEGIAASTREPIGAVREMSTELLKLGGPVAANLGDGMRAALAIQRLTGQSANDVAQQFGGLSNGVAAWAAKANASYGFLTAAQYAQVRALEAQGRTSEATGLVLAELAQTMDQRVSLAMTETDRRLQALTSTFSKFWDELKKGGQDQTAEERLKRIQEEIQNVESKLPILDRLMLALFPQSYGGQQVAQQKSALVSSLEADEAAMRASVNRGALNAAERAANAKLEQDTIERQSAAYQSALAAIEKAGAAQRLAASTVGYAQQQAAADIAFQRGEITARAYQDTLLKIELGRIDAQAAQMDRLRQIEAARKPTSETDSLQQRAALVQMDAQRTALAEKRVKLLSDEARGLRAVTPAALASDPRDALRAFKAQDERNVEQALKERTADSIKAQAEVVAANKAGAIMMIKDDRERGLALIAIERQVLEQRLNLRGLEGEERRKVEDDLATWQMQRERKLTEDLKPEWQRRMELWADTNRLMKDSYDTLMGGIVSQGEDAFVNFMRTGKLNTRSLVDFMITEFARLEYRKNLAPMVANGAQSLLGFFGLGGGGGGGMDWSALYNGLAAVGGGAATGTNELERDMITLVHKGEAVVPKQFNPWAGGNAPAAMGGQQTVQNITYNVPPGMSPAAFAGALEQNNRRLKGELASDMTRPGRPLQRAAARSGRF